MLLLKIFFRSFFNRKSPALYALCAVIATTALIAWYSSVAYPKNAADVRGKSMPRTFAFGFGLGIGGKEMPKNAPSR